MSDMPRDIRYLSALKAICVKPRCGTIILADQPHQLPDQVRRHTAESHPEARP